MQGIDFVRSKIKSAGVRTQGLIARLETLDKNRDGIVHFDDVDYILAELMGKKDQLSRREARILMLAMSDNVERGEVLYHKLYDILDKKPIDNGQHEKWKDCTADLDTIGGVRFTKRSIRTVPSKQAYNRVSDDRDPVTESSATYVPRGSIGDWLHKRATEKDVKNFRSFVHALERYERDSGMRIEDTKQGFMVPIGPDLKVSVEFRVI